MSSDPIVFAGVDISSGRKPVTFAALDEDLNVLAFHKWTLDESVSCLKDYEKIVLAVNAPEAKLDDFKKRMTEAGFKPVSKQNSQQWLETDAQQSYLALCRGDLFPRRTVEGRIQRALILYDERLRIPDPMDFFEEITRHKMMQGVLPLENMYSSQELDALMAAYMAWMYINEPRQVQIVANKALPLSEVEN